MPDWTSPFSPPKGDPLPPLTNPEDADPKSPDWVKAIGKAVATRGSLYTSTIATQWVIETTTTVGDASFPVSGDNPGPWEKIGRKDVGDKDYILWQRVYPTVSFQAYKILTVNFTLVKKHGIGAINAGKEISREALPPPLVFWIKVGKPYVVKNCIYFVWEESSVHRTAADGTKSYVEVATPPYDYEDWPGVPLPNGKFGDPKRELKIARAEFRDDGALVALGLTVRDPEGNPIAGAKVTLEGEHVGVTAANGGLEFTHFIARPSEQFFLPLPSSTKNPKAKG